MNMVQIWRIKQDSFHIKKQRCMMPGTSWTEEKKNYQKEVKSVGDERK